MQTRRRSSTPALVLGLGLALACAGCPTMAITMGASTAASILADDRSLAQQGADLDTKTQIEQGLLSQAPALAGAVNVDVFLGRVMLTGVVPDDDARWQASRIARQIAGDREVYDDIEIGSGGGIASAADNIATNKELGLAMLADEGLASQSLLHRVVNGTAFILGEVQSPRQIDTARAVALQVPGVVRVVTHITLEQ